MVEFLSNTIRSTDNSNKTVKVTVSGSVNVNVAGEYIITYTATDPSGNSSTCVRYVNVLE